MGHFRERIYLNAGPDVLPIAFKILAKGQKPVKDACSILKPINAVKPNQ